MKTVRLVTTQTIL